MNAERKVIRLASERPGAKEATDILLELAAMAERGEIVAISAVYEMQDGCMRNWQSGGASPNKMAGALLDAAVRRLGYVEG